MAHSSASISVNTSLITTSPIVDNVHALLDISIRTQVCLNCKPDVRAAGDVGVIRDKHVYVTIMSKLNGHFVQLLD